MLALNSLKVTFLSLVLLASLVTGIYSCKKAGAGSDVIIQPMNNPGIPVAASKNYLALGDSYTIGESVSAKDRFPSQLAAVLSGEAIPVGTPDIIATTGWTTGNLLSALANNPPASNFDIVTLLIGVNNQYQGRPLLEYKTEFETLLKQAITYAGNQKKHVFVLSIPDYSVTPFAANSDRAKIAREIDEFNAAARQICTAYEISFIDITGISRENDPALTAGDGLHPSGKQYQRWVALLAPLVKASL